MIKLVYSALFCALVLQSVQGAIITETNCSCVAFRFDDVQDYWLSGVQQAVMEVFQSGNDPLTLGIIANYFGTDTGMVNYVKSRIGGTWNMEVACHGFNHEDFTNFTSAEQGVLLDDSRNKIQNTLGLTADKLVTFIPPLNAWNADTVALLPTKGFKYMTSEVDLDPPPHPLIGQTFYRFPTGAATGSDDMTSNSPTTYDVTWAQVQTQLGNEGYSVVMLHPQDFATNNNGTLTDSQNTAMFDGLKQLIASIKAAGLRIVPIREINVDGIVGSTTGVAPIVNATTGVVNSTTTGLTTGSANVTSTGASTTGIRTNSTTTASTGATTGKTTSTNSTTTGVKVTSTTTTGVNTDLNNNLSSNGVSLQIELVAIALFSTVLALF